MQFKFKDITSKVARLSFLFMCMNNPILSHSRRQEFSRTTTSGAVIIFNYQKLHPFPSITAEKIAKKRERHPSFSDPGRCADDHRSFFRSQLTTYPLDSTAAAWRFRSDPNRGGARAAQAFVAIRNRQRPSVCNDRLNIPRCTGCCCCCS